MELKTYFKSLENEADIQAYAERCGTSANYLKIHTIPVRKIPKKPFMVKLSEGSEGKVSVDEVLNHFYSDISESEFKQAANG